MSDKSVFVINESDSKSIASDIFSFACLVGAFWINHQFLGDGIILQLVLAVMFFIMAFARGSKNVIKRMTVDEARKYFCGAPQ